MQRSSVRCKTRLQRSRASRSNIDFAKVSVSAIDPTYGIVVWSGERVSPPMQGGQIVLRKDPGG